MGEDIGIGSREGGACGQDFEQNHKEGQKVHRPSFTPDAMQEHD